MRLVVNLNLCAPCQSTGLLCVCRCSVPERRSSLVINRNLAEGRTCVDDESGRPTDGQRPPRSHARHHTSAPRQFPESMVVERTY